MRIDTGLVLGIVLETVFFLYYAETSFYRKKSRLFCYTATVLCYAAYFIICTFNNVTLNTTLYFIINAALFTFCYHVDKKSALFQSAALSLLSFATEIIVSCICQFSFVLANPAMITPSQSLILTIASKMLYLIGIMIMLHFYRKNNTQTASVSTGLIIIDFFAIIILISLIPISMISFNLTVICAALMVIVFITVFLNQKIVTQQTENEMLKLQIEKDLRDFESYEQLNIMRHDIKEHINTAAALIDGSGKAAEYLRDLRAETEAVEIVDYSDNEMLNIIISKKKEECRKAGISFSLEPVRASLAFFERIDTVSIFSNLINNAIESSEKSEKKKIFMSVYTVNENFVTVRIENSSDIAPIVTDGHLKTHKDNDKLHGIGMSSIKRTLKKYRGILAWSYDKEKQVFCTTITVKKCDF